MRKLAMIAAALALSACGGNTEAAAPRAVTAPPRTAMSLAAGQPWFAANGITYLPISVKLGPNVGDEDWYQLCAYDAAGTQHCKKLLPVSVMQGLSVQSQLGADGTPWTLYAQTATAGPDTGKKQSALMALMEARLAQAIAEFDAGCAADTDCPTAASALRSGRAPASAARRTGTTGSDADPDPRRARLGGGKRLQELPDAGSIDVPGPRPDPEYPSPIDSPPADPAPVPDPADPGAAGDGGMPEQPDGGDGWRRLKAPKETCIALPPLPGFPAVAGGCVVAVPHPKPLPDPDAAPLPIQPKPDWCQVLPGLCGGTSALPPDPRYAICASHYVVESMQCVDDYNHGKITREKRTQCLDLKYANLIKCQAELGIYQTAPATVR
jgi:hypothetical protein